MAPPFAMLPRERQPRKRSWLLGVLIGLGAPVGCAVALIQHRASATDVEVQKIRQSGERERAQLQEQLDAYNAAARDCAFRLGGTPLRVMGPFPVCLKQECVQQ